MYSLSETELEEIQKYIDKIVRKGKICLSSSLAGPPILFISKANGYVLQLCFDYHGLNKLTVKNRYSLLVIDDLRNYVAVAEIFIKINFKSGYYHIRIKEGEE